MNKIPVYFLLVDDLEENLLALEALLRRDGLVCLKARSGTEALELLLQHEVALALLDVQMPGMDGFELAELMRGTERTQRVPIIFVTAGSADWRRRFRGYEAGAVDFLHKPIEADILRSKATVFFDLYRHKHKIELQRDELEASIIENERLLKESRQYADALKDADRRKDEFLATLAHELRNPLAPIRNGLQILRMSDDSKRIGEVRDMMDRQMTHLVRLIDDLLDVSRVSQGKIDLRKTAVTLQDILQAAVEASRPLIEEHNHALTLQVPPQIIWLDADLTRMAQVVSNILNNAAKYTPDGGRITLAATQQNDSIVLSVTDTGLGIRADMLPKVFDLFTQVDQNMDRAQGGLGIGLALVKQLVDMHGGTIRADSAGMNKGSVFIVTLPVAQAEQPAEDIQAAQPDNAALHPLKILVVDDNIPSAKTTGWMLEMIGYTPDMVHDGNAAIEAAHNLQPDVILLDIGLPGKDGYEVCRELRQNPAFKNTVIIAQTGWGQARDRQLAKEAGFDHHLTKPVSLDDLTALIEKVKPSAD